MTIRGEKAGPAHPAGVARSTSSFCIVAIGASAGGLEAFTGLLSACPPAPGMAFVLVQHLDPTHESLMAELLASHTPMAVHQAEDGMAIEPDHVYVIPPGAELSVAGDTLHLSHPPARYGTRNPIDVLLLSLAKSAGARAIGVVLSGTGADGSEGLVAIKDAGGLVIAQDPAEAGFDGMPRSAIATGRVDLILPVAKMPDAILAFVHRSRDPETVAARPPAGGSETPKARVPATAEAPWLADIITLLRERTPHDFTLYKPGTLRRRIERRMAMASIGADDGGAYLALLRGDAEERDRLSRDLLIHVTGFFRDTAVFKTLGDEVIPRLVREHESDRPIRVWVAGCSSGEEAYSLAMLVQEQIEAGQRGQKLQVFASDLDAASIAHAREGLFPPTIANDIPHRRLVRFFDEVEQGYRVKVSLRSDVVFAVQDVLTDPPFSRIDLVSCRNLLIYLGAEAQQKVLSLFHFALRPNGILVLGNAETPTLVKGGFSVVSQAGRIYRRTGRGLVGDIGLHAKGEGVARPDPLARPSSASASASAEAELAALCERALLDGFAPAAVLVDLTQTCLHVSGAIARYLSIPSGPATNSILRMVAPALRPRLRAALQRAGKDKARVVIPGGTTVVDGRTAGYEIDVRPVAHGDDTLLLVCFRDRPEPVASPSSAPGPDQASRLLDLERDTDALRADLQDALREVEVAHQQQKIASEEALSINEEYQSTNEELLISKEELQSLNEELTALNTQLRETLDRERTTSDDLQNVLFSTDVATLFLDRRLNIRFFTPATTALFNVIAGDVGRPVSDLHLVAADEELLADARKVLTSLVPIEKEVRAADGRWVLRRILPYRNKEAAVGGVVITFVDVTERRRVDDALKAAEDKAQKATAAKTRFLAAASHDLRQPLQTIALLQGLLAKAVQGDAEKRLVARLDDTLDSMASMLNTLLDVNQIEAGIVQPEFQDFAVGDLLRRMRDEFQIHAESKGLSLRMVPCGTLIRSDPKLLKQILRNLLSNALKYTRKGKILLGCRRHAGNLSIEIWDTGLGIASQDLAAIFEEYHQLDNAARERSRGLGLGLAIVQRLTAMLNHRVTVRSQPGRGSAFAVEVSLPTSVEAPSGDTPPLPSPAPARHHDTGTILLVEDDPVVLELLTLFLVGEGHRVETAADGPAAMALVTGGLRPDVVLTDFNLPLGMSGVVLSVLLRQGAGAALPVIVLSGDIATETFRAIAQADCVHLNKPVKLSDLSEAIDVLMKEVKSSAPPAPPGPGPAPHPTVYVIDDDRSVRDAMRTVLEDGGMQVKDYATAEAFLAAYVSGPDACLIVDAYLPGLAGVDLLSHLKDLGTELPSIMITGSSDVPIAVRAMKAGAFDFIEKPVRGDDLLASVARALQQARDRSKPSEWKAQAVHALAGLTARQREIMHLVLAGHPSKNIAADLAISQRTVENHRAAIMRKTGAKSLPALARLALAAGDARS